MAMDIGYLVKTIDICDTIVPITMGVDANDIFSEMATIVNTASIKISLISYLDAITIISDGIGSNPLGFVPTRITKVRSLPGKPFHRVLISLQMNPENPSCVENELTIELEHHIHSPEYQSLTENFFLRYEQNP